MDVVRKLAGWSKERFISFTAAVEVLQKNGIIRSPDYWLQNAVTGKTVIGEYAGMLLISIALKFQNGVKLGI